MSQVLKTVTVFIALLYDGVWRTVGEVLEMEKGRADVLAAKNPPVVKFGEHDVPAPEAAEPGAPAGAAEPVAKSGPVFTPADFPGAEFLAKAGILNPDQLGEFVKAKGDAWFNEVEGVGKATAAKIADYMEKLTAAAAAAAP